MRGVDEGYFLMADVASRFIPTCVGSIVPGCPWTGLNTVHPHMRGVDALSPLTSAAVNPVHPHMRGVDDLLWG